MPTTWTASKTAAYTAAAGEYVQANATSAAFTVTLPASPGNGTVVGVRKTDTSTNVVTVAPGAGASIDTTPLLRVLGASVTLQLDGTVWRTLNAGMQLPTGGATGTALIKNTSTNFDTAWSSNGLIPSGGTANQVLSKNTSTNYDVSWKTVGAGADGAGQLFPWTAGRYHTVPVRPTDIATNVTLVGASYTWFVPVMVPNACTITGVGISASAAIPNTTPLWIGLFADSGSATSKGPAALLASGSASGTGATSLFVTLSCALSGPTPIWVGYTSNAYSQTVYGFNNQAQIRNTLNFYSGNIFGELSSNINVYYTSAYTYSSPFTGSAAGVPLNPSGNQPPLFAFTVA